MHPRKQFLTHKIDSKMQFTNTHFFSSTKEVTEKAQLYVNFVRCFVHLLGICNEISI